MHCAFTWVSSAKAAARQSLMTTLGPRGLQAVSQSIGSERSDAWEGLTPPFINVSTLLLGAYPAAYCVLWLMWRRRLCDPIMLHGLISIIKSLLRLGQHQLNMINLRQAILEFGQRGPQELWVSRGNVLAAVPWKMQTKANGIIRGGMKIAALPRHLSCGLPQSAKNQRCHKMLRRCFITYGWPEIWGQSVAWWDHPRKKVEQNREGQKKRQRGQSSGTYKLWVLYIAYNTIRICLQRWHGTNWPQVLGDLRLTKRDNKN